MRLFVSWSGRTSRNVAKELVEWFEDLFPGLEIFYSPEIPAGKQWPQELRNALQDSQFAVLVLTPDNREQPWLIWEGGALSSLPVRIVPFLFHLDTRDLPAPLQDFQAVRYSGNDEADWASLELTLSSLLEVADLNGGARRIAEELASHRWPALRDALRHLRPPAELSLSKILQEIAKGLSHLKQQRVAALASFGFGAYTSLIARLVEFLRQYDEPWCNVYNTLQPRDYAEEILRDRRGGFDARISEAKIREFLLDPTAGVFSNEELSREARRVFPSIGTLSSFAAQYSGRLRRITIVERPTRRSELQLRSCEFLDGLMGAPGNHYIIEEPDAARAVAPTRLHQSDFALWRCEEIEILTDYHPSSATLLVSWRAPGEESAFMDYYNGVFDSVKQSSSISPIVDYISKLRASSSG